MEQIVYNDLIIEVKDVTPKMAEEILINHNGLNRKINKRHVEALALNMCKGSWKFNGDAVRFDNKGNLIDGQHRLSAIVACNKTMPLLLISGLDESIIRTIDQEVKPRNLSDILKMDGIDYANKVASCLNRYFALKSSCNSFIDSNRTHGSSAATSVNITKGEYTVYDKYNEYKEHSEFWQSVVRYAMDCNSYAKILKVPEIGAVYAYLVLDKGHSEDSVEKFFNGIFKKIGNYPLLITFRDMYLKDQLADIPMMPKTRSMLLIKTWNYYCNNELDRTDIDYDPSETLNFI